MTDKEFQLIDKRFDGIVSLLNGVNTRLDGINGKVYSHENQIQEALGERKVNRENQKKVSDKVDELEVRTTLLEKDTISHIIKCPVAPRVQVLENESLSNRTIKKFMAGMFAGGMAIGGLTVAVLKLILG